MAIWTTPVNKNNGVVIGDTDWNTIQENLRYLKGTGGLAVELDTAALSVLGEYRSQGAAPAVWLDQTGTSAIGARWVLNGGSLQLQSRTAGYGANVATPLILIDMVNTPANTMRVGANGVAIGLASAPLNKLDVNGGAAFGTYAGVNAAPSGGAIMSGNFGVGYATVAAGKVAINGDVGIGTNSPSSRLDVRDSVGGFKIVTFNVPDANWVTVLPIGTAANGIVISSFVAKASINSYPQTMSPSTLALTLGVTDQQLIQADASNRLLISTYANGSATIRRDGTGATYRGTFFLSWC